MKRQAAAFALAAMALAGCNREPSPSAAPGNGTGNASSPELNAAAPSTPEANLAVSPAAARPVVARNGDEFVALVGAGDRFEIESARVALERSRNAAVRALAQMILDDHQKASRDLAAAAARATPPIRAATDMNSGQQANLTALRTASATGFDQVYLEQQVEAHEQALRLVTDFAANGDVDTLRRHASAVAAPVQRHLSRARELIEQAAQPPA